MRHPLLNIESAGHYDQKDKTAIHLLEESATVAEQVGWCKGNIAKYKYRCKYKGEEAKDIKKIETYENYLLLLQSLVPEALHMRVFEAYQKYGVRLTYY